MNPFNLLPEDFPALRSTIRKNGFAFLQSHATPEACKHIKNFIDWFPEIKAEINYGGSEKRIWDSQALDPVIQAFAKYSDKLMGEIFSVQPNVKTVLSYSNFPIAAQESLRTGRWHLDSLRHQYKLFCFLTLTDEQSGPLEVVLGSHRTSFKIWPLVSGKYISHSDVGTGKRRYQQLDEQWVETQCRKRGGSVPFLCEAGTLILVDTSAIHRARPCLNGHRYALCAYYDHF